MELLPFLFMSSCFLTLSGLTVGDQSGKPVIVKDGDDAILPCSFDESIEHVRFEWKKEGTEKEVFIHDTGLNYSPALGDRVSHFRDDLKNGNASIKIKNAQLEDGGNYTCSFPSKGKTFRIGLVVGAAKPYVTSHDQINGWVLLQCDVKHAYPKPKVEWRDSDNQIIHSEEQVSKQGDHVYITLKATVKKTGRYRCVATQGDINHQAQQEINVHTYGVTVNVSEESDVILPCSLSTNQNLDQKLFDWRKKAPTKQEVFMYDGGLHYNNGRRGQDEHFRGRVSHFPQELQFGNASIIIRNTTVADSGVYTCDFPYLQPEQRFCIKLVVGETHLERSIRRNPSEDEALLKCEVRGASPKPKVEWRDSDGNILPAEEPQVSHTGERYDITLLTTVTRTNSSLFHCVATQEEMGHVTRDQIDVRYCALVFLPFSCPVVTAVTVRRKKHKNKTASKEQTAEFIKLHQDNLQISLKV
ncbi:hypothetical protein ACER0C_019941 [Sarotherodon galilaeus]